LVPKLIYAILFFLRWGVVLGFELRLFTLGHSTSPIFVMGFVEIGSLELFARWLRTAILLISAS
jgi:hypothetical protein